MAIDVEAGDVPGAPTQRPLAAALAAQLALWPLPRIDVGSLEDDWITAAALFADEAALEDHLDYQGSFDEGVDRRSRAAFLLSDYCAMFCGTAVPLLVGARLVPEFDPSRYALQFYTAEMEHDGHKATVRRAHVRLLSFSFATDEETLAAHPDAQFLLDGPGLRQIFRWGVETHFTPLIRALNRMTGLPWSAMWRLVGDALGAAFLDAGRRYGCLEDAKAAAMTILKKVGSPLRNKQMHFVTITVRDDADPERVLSSYDFRARGGCCRYYLIKGKPLCSTCVLQDPATRDRLLERKIRRRLGLAVT